MRQLLTSLVLAAWLANLALAQAPAQPAAAPADPAIALPEVPVEPTPELLSEFRDARRVLVQKVLSKQPDQQIQALQELQAYPFSEAAKLVLGRLRDPNAQVARAAYETLLTYRNQKDVLPLLMQTLRKEGLTQVDSGYVALLTAVAASELPQAQEQLLVLFDASVGAHPRRWQRLTVALDNLAKEGGPPALATLCMLRQSQPFQKDFGFRRAVVQAVIALQMPEAVEQLIAWLEFVDGEVRGDILGYLTRLAGEYQGPEPKQWAQWWETAKADFEFPAPLPVGAATVATVEGQPLAQSDSDRVRWGKTRYYGLPVYGKRLVFVLDASSSMLQGTRITDAKMQLISAVNELDDGFYFNIVVYNQVVGAWQRGALQATESARKNAARYVASIQPQATTATYDALEAAFAHPEVEAIYLVTDGAPTAGKILNLDQIVKAISDQNQTRRVSLNVIGIQPEPPFEVFLKALAEQNFGTYRRVD